MPETSWDELWQIIFLFFVLSVVFESALTPVFNWRIFASRFEGRGIKTPVTVGLAFVVFWGFDLDIIKDLLNAFGLNEGEEYTTSLGGQILTALLIAGGSDGVFRVFTRLGLRDPSERARKATQSTDSHQGTTSSE